MSDTSKTQELQNWFSVAETERQKLWDTPAKEDKDFYWGRQWTSTEKAKLGEEGRPALTFNEIFPIVNFVSGSQRQNRQDLKVIHKQGGNPITAEIMTMLMKDIEDSCNAPWHISRVFLDGLISRRGYLGFEINYDEDIVNGNLIEKRLKPDRVFIDPSSEEYDHSDAAHMFIIKWQTRKQLELEFPDKKDELTLMTVDAKDKMSQPIPASTGDYEKDTGGAELDKYKLRVRYCYYMTREIV
ncbi:hypothetical protein KAX35_02160, partial [candidate division WOR-3 bacterium]|nr:hypothetical protein [candidate division WOR-3 bacterium]